MSNVHIYRGDTFDGTIQLRSKDAANPTVANPYTIPVGSTVEVVFPGETTPVILSTANVGEVTIIDANLATVAYVGDPSKSVLLAISSKAAIETRVTTLAGKVTTFVASKILTVEDPPNG